MAESAVELAVKLLARREHSARELERKLKSRGFGVAAVAGALADLRKRNLQSDQRFAEQYVLSRVRQGYGPVRIQAELRERGVERETIGESLVPYEDRWQALCVQARRKRFGDGGCADARERARRQRYLSYRGFTAPQIAGAIDHEEDEPA